MIFFSIEAASQEPLNQHRREAQQQQSEAIQEGTEQEEQQTAVDDDEDIGIEGLENPSEVGSEPITVGEFRKEIFITGSCGK